MNRSSFRGKGRIIAGYATDRSLSFITEEAAERLTHLNVAFGLVDDGLIVTSQLKNLDRLNDLKAFNPDLVTLLSIGGWGAGGFSNAALTGEGRERFAESAVAAMKGHRFDGLDLDWEYPCYAVAGIDADPNDKTNFTKLLRTLREALDEQGEKDGRYYGLTIAAGADRYYIDGTEMEKATEYLDFVQLMTYDMRGGFQTLTGHHTNLYPSTGDLFRISVSESVRLFESAGVPREKLVIGCAFYSRIWKDVPNVNRGLHQMTASFGGGGPDYKTLVRRYIGQSGYVRHWDDEAKAPYLFDGHEFITYDDEESIGWKCKYAREEGIAGIMFWEYGCDPSDTLLNALHRGLAE